MSSGIESSMADYYARRAREYERIYEKPERQEDLQRLRQLVLTALREPPVLEVACGTGWWTQCLADAGLPVVALDINQKTLELARSKPGLAGKVRWIEENAYALPENLGAYPSGFSAFWWSHVPRPRLKEFLHGFHKRLLPQAQVVFIDNRFVEGSSTPISRTDMSGNTYQLRQLEDGTQHEVVKNFPTPEELLTTVADHADQARVHLLEYYWMLEYRVRQTSNGFP